MKFPVWVTPKSHKVEDPTNFTMRIWTYLYPVVSLKTGKRFPMIFRINKEKITITNSAKKRTKRGGQRTRDAKNELKNETWQ